MAFNLILEAATAAASNVSVTFNQLTGPGGSTISSVPTTGNGVFNWTNRNIENFYVRYLQINGLSLLSYDYGYDERHIPQRFQRPWTGQGVAVPGTTWANRPDHNKYYPDIAEPLELVPTFNIASGQNQSIWSDIYIPKTATPGLYTGTVTVQEGSNLSYAVPVALTVYPFALPDVPSLKTMLHAGVDDIATRYTGTSWPSAAGVVALDRHFQMAHRHKISMIDDEPEVGDQPSAGWVPRLSGSLFTAAGSSVSGVGNYAGPGVGVGNGVYSIGTYGNWQSEWGTSQSDIQTNTNNWETWFEANFPSTTRFVYLIDESTDYTQTQQWANWMLTNPGIGSKLPSMATLDLPNAVASVPSLTIPTSSADFGVTATWQSALATLRQNSKDSFYEYNGFRPAVGSFATEDDGVALRELAWAQYKEGINRWFFWDSTYYDDYQTGISPAQTNVWTEAATFSGTMSTDPILGETGNNHSNGDGVLFYPGTDTLYPAQSLGLAGPVASLRLKHWRRGIQDADYLTLAAAINPTAVQALVTQMVPLALWEYGVANPSDPTYVYANISWSIDPDTWEAARVTLANIILGGQPALKKATLKKPIKPKAKHKPAKKALKSKLENPSAVRRARRKPIGS